MHVTHLSITNIRSVAKFVFELQAEECAGWHVVLGANAAGKSTVIRSLAVALTGPQNAFALNQVWRDWQRQDASPGSIQATVICHPGHDFFSNKDGTTTRFDATVALVPREGSSDQLELVGKNENAVAERSIWASTENYGWFAASFGPYRRFTGGDTSYDRLFQSSPRIAGHLSAFNEAVALTEGLRWLSTLRGQSVDNPESGRLLEAVLEFINHSDLLPNGSSIAEVRSDRVLMRDSAGAVIATDLLSDGYRSVLSMVFELIRQLSVAYETEALLHALGTGGGAIALPGVVAIDEVDAHLHPDWQAQIGGWFTRVFPQMQFVVTTHSPIVCRSARSIWFLPRPGLDEQPRRIEGQDFDRLTTGSILDAYGTELFGRGVSRSPQSREMLTDLAVLNRKALKGKLDDAEVAQMDLLRAALPSRSAELDA